MLWEARIPLEWPVGSRGWKGGEEGSMSLEGGVEVMAFWEEIRVEV